MNSSHQGTATAMLPPHSQPRGHPGHPSPANQAPRTTRAQDKGKWGDQGIKPSKRVDFTIENVGGLPSKMLICVIKNADFYHRKCGCLLSKMWICIIKNGMFTGKDVDFLRAKMWMFISKKNGFTIKHMDLTNNFCLLSNSSILLVELESNQKKETNNTSLSNRFEFSVKNCDFHQQKWEVYLQSVLFLPSKV